jgi:hypothetical protein
MKIKCQKNNYTEEIFKYKIISKTSWKRVRWGRKRPEIRTLKVLLSSLPKKEE